MNEDAFPDPLLLEFIDGQEWLVMEPFRYRDQITVPEGFITDFASIPRLYWWRYPPAGGPWARAAVIHDFAYWDNWKRNRKACDELFRAAMKDSGVHAWTRQVMYLAVRVRGGHAWQEHRTREIEAMPTRPTRH